MEKNSKTVKTYRQSNSLCALFDALIFIYGPLDSKALNAKIGLYAPDLLNKINSCDADTIRMLLSGFHYFQIDQQGLFVYPGLENINRFLKIEWIERFCRMSSDKQFADISAICNYADCANVLNCKEFDKLKAYVDALSFKQPQQKETLFRELCEALYKFNGIDKPLQKIENATKGAFNSRDLYDLAKDLGNVLPRCFLHGYSLKEVGADIEDLRKHPASLNSCCSSGNPIFLKPDYCYSFGTFSYAQCQKMAYELKQTHLFRYFVNNKVVEMLVNGKEFYVQFVYTGSNERKIYIHKNREDLLAALYFQKMEKDRYPDLSYRMDNYEIFFDRTYIGLPDSFSRTFYATASIGFPLIFDNDARNGLGLPKQEDLDLVGAVLITLLRINSFNLSRIGINKDPRQIIQLYLLANGQLMAGTYYEYKAGSLYLPFNVKKPKNLNITAKNKGSIAIGVYACFQENDDEVSYLLLINEIRKGYLFDTVYLKQNQLADILKLIVNVLEKNNVRPADMLLVNNGYTFELLKKLYGIYNVPLKIMDDPQEMNELYQRVKAFGSIGFSGYYRK